MSEIVYRISKLQFRCANDLLARSWRRILILSLMVSLPACATDGDEHYGGPFLVGDAIQPSCENVGMQEALQTIGPRTLFNHFRGRDQKPSNIKPIINLLYDSTTDKIDESNGQCKWTYDIVEEASNGLPGFPGGVVRLELTLKGGDDNNSRELCVTRRIFRNRLTSLEQYSASAVDLYVRDPTLVPNSTSEPACAQLKHRSLE